MKKRNKKKMMIALFSAILVCSAVIVGIILAGSKGRELKRQINLGQQYLTEMNYEEAIVLFRKALELDPVSLEAYVGLADAYVFLAEGYERDGDFVNAGLKLEEAVAVLKKGIETITGAGKDADALSEKLGEVEAKIELLEKQLEEKRAAEEGARQLELEKQWQGFSNLVDKIEETTPGRHSFDPTGLGIYRARDEKENLLRPLIEELESYIDFLLNSGYSMEEMLFMPPSCDNLGLCMTCDGYYTLETAFRRLVWLYLRIDDAESAKRVRREYCDYYRLTGYADGPHEDQDSHTVDEFGRDYSEFHVYEGAHCLEESSYYGGKEFGVHLSYQYDEQGRVIYFSSVSEGTTMENYISYEGGNPRFVSYYNGKERTGTYVIDEYGYMIESIYD